MTNYEIIAISCSILAIIIAFASFIRARKVAQEQCKLAKQQLELEKVTAKLSNMQIEEMIELNANKIKPFFNVSFNRVDNSKGYFCIENIGQGIAYNVNFDLIDCLKSPISSNKLKELPFLELEPLSTFQLIASVAYEYPTTYQVKLIWQDSEDNEYDKIFLVQLVS